MNNSIKLALVAAVAVAGIAACTSTPAPRHDAVSQPSSTPTSETSSPPTVVTEVVIQTVTNPNPPAPDAVAEVDHRFGYGVIKLGMTLDEARAAGLTDLTWDSNDNCVADDKLAISKKYGIVRISLPKDAKTSKGIGAGSTFADVKRAYPNASEYRAGWSAKLTDEVGYSFLGEPGNDANKVTGLKLGTSQADCAMAFL